MYAYTDFDRRLVRDRAAQYRDQLERHLRGELCADDFRPLRLQNGWYVQRHAPMLRVAIPYGVLSSRQLRALAHVADAYDLQDAGLPTERGGFGHFTTRQNLQFNWIPLERSADVMDVLAQADLHGIQTSGNCIRNITTDAFAGVAPDEAIDPRPYCELIRQWSTLHPEFAYLPRKFKVAVTGAREDRAAIGWHDVGLRLRHDDAGAVGFEVLAGGGMGRTPLIAAQITPFVPWQQVLLFIEAILRVYNRFGRRDNLYKARLKILVRAEGRRFVDAVHEEFRAMLDSDLGAQSLLIPQAELDRVAASFAVPQAVLERLARLSIAPVAAPSDRAWTRWLERCVAPHRLPGLRVVTLSLKRTGQPPGDVTAAQMRAAADLADRHGGGELRVSHDQNLVLPWVHEHDLPALWAEARALGLASPNVGLLTDMIACPGGDLCALANARSIPVAAAIAERFDDLDRLHDIGEVDLHVSGCINSCGHHHSGHLGILGVDKDGSEWYQLTVGGSDGSYAGGPAAPGRIVGPAFAADEIVDAVEAVVEAVQAARAPGERFVEALRRVGVERLRGVTDAVRGAAGPVRAQAT